MVETSDGPLSGFKVVDFSRVLAGPHCGRMLVDMGAEVIKVEPPDGDILRSGKPRRNSLTPGFTHQNVGKRNISIDMKRSEGVDLARQLLTKTDVVLENFRPGVMAKMGLGYDAVAQLNPGVVYASISGYGQTGSWVHRRAYAPLVHAEMGYLDGTARYLGTEVRQEPMSHTSAPTRGAARRKPVPSALPSTTRRPARAPTRKKVSPVARASASRIGRAASSEGSRSSAPRPRATKPMPGR